MAFSRVYHKVSETIFINLYILSGNQGKQIKKFDFQITDQPKTGNFLFIFISDLTEIESLSIVFFSRGFRILYSFFFNYKNDINNLI